MTTKVSVATPKRRRTKRAVGGTVLACLGIVWISVPGSALAKRLDVGIADPILLNPQADVRAHWLDAVTEARAQFVRFDVIWSEVAREQPINAEDPADPAYDFSRLDAAIRDADARGLRALLTFSSAPRFAEGADPREPDQLHPAGTWKPRPRALSAFAKAVARRYSGTHAGGGGLLPEVRYFEVWNEPNISLFLNPQWGGKGGMTNVAAPHYRKMVNAFETGVHRSNRRAKVIAGSTAPFGDDPPNDIRTRPLKFMRELLCLGGGLKANCKRKTRFDIYSHHPINIYGGPRRSGQSPDDASAVVDFRRVKRTLRAAERQGTVTGGRHGLWSTEMWWETDPPDSTNGFAMHQAERFVAEASYLLWKLGVKNNFWYQLVDSPLGANRSDGLQAGFYFADGSSKPTLTALRFPFVAERSSKRIVKGWAIPPESGAMLIERKEGDSWVIVKRLTVSQGHPATMPIRSRGNPELRARVGSSTSSPWSLQRGAGAASRRTSRSDLRRQTSALRTLTPSVLAPYLESAP